MNTGSLVKWSFITGIILVALGAYMKIIHAPFANFWLAAGLIFSFLFICAALYEIWTSENIRQQEKLMWTIVLLLMGSIGGLIYFFVGRRKVNQA